ncbi:hypothetical protein K439DRAFT_1625498 [Ramaria rubella]|nr:hypothetical protein K439DRAFT_1625498 [Ramaria rubella]
MTILDDTLQAQKLKRSTSPESEDEGTGAVNDLRSPLLGLISNHYIKVIHHPHSGNSAATVIPLDQSISTTQHNCSPQNVHNCNGKLWAPFCNRANFEFAEEAVTQGFRAEMVNKLLDGYQGRWATQMHLTLCNNKDLQNSLAAARKFGVQIQDGEVMHEYQGKTHMFWFKF